MEIEDIEDQSGSDIMEANQDDGVIQEIGAVPEPSYQSIQVSDDKKDAPPEIPEPLPPVHPINPPVQAKLQKPTTQKPTTKLTNRQVMSVAVSNEQFEYLQTIFEARKASGLSTSWNHFLKQCLNYAVNWQKGWQFGVPKDINKVYLD